jgi:pimeloyl-ACP methyl ester carboxylesterase
MPRIDVNGVSIAYELIGEGEKAVTITPGGRFSKDTPGVRQLAQALAAEGYKALIWDRPNCGESDLSFAGECESFQNADTLAALIQALGLGKPLVYGASGGSREALLVAIRHPEVVSGVMCQWLSGGGIGCATLPIAYCATPAIAASIGGMEAVLDAPDFAEPLARNPSNRERLLAFEPEPFVRLMRDWAEYFFPQPGMPIPCVGPGDLEGIEVPVVILRSGKSDIHHTRETSEAVAARIPGAELQEPPWGDREWMERLAADMKDKSGLFVSMPKLVPQMVAFAKSFGHG